ncbi:MAG: HAD family phosphatase [Nitriliruptor sp.]|nr:MAG: HAD family phosphatase [Nitriliruptor sp.]
MEEGLVDAPKAVLCDLGGVVIRIDPDRIRRRWAARSPLPASEVHAAYPDAAYEAFERDELSAGEYLAHVRERLQLQGDDDELAADFNDLYLGADAAVVDLLWRLRHRGVRLIALTNSNRLHHQVWSRRFSAELGVFETIHCSHDLRARKPERAAFERVLDAHGLAPSATVFVDDLPANVEAARALGLQGLVFTGATTLADDLARLGLLDTAAH